MSRQPQRRRPSAFDHRAVLREYPLTISYDWDETVSPWLAPVLELGNQRFGTELKPDDLAGRELQDLWGCTRSEVEHFIAVHHGDGGQLLRGAREYIGRLRQDGFQHCITSARPTAHAELTRRVVQRHLDGLFSDDQIHVVGNFRTDPEFTPKTAIFRANQISAHVDDDPRYLRECLEAGIVAIQFGEYTWARERVAGAYQAGTWSRVYQLITSRAVVNRMLEQRYGITLPD
ncbi:MULTISPECIES: hypothetical protein [Kitasatospora]|uniref:Uncharacterized protein n=1 Tax=Kitasatospora setae (strain ATCC 33774 / DSM 43861 / JCM 3304 / KCC A-0304 / NBRC 14216 / KM-6054) TaxID=452652 RepID=E4NHM6_KITSK|nr:MULTISPECIES: hypothetical protein [Kitasatospora]BAJ31006.1 hypothetical protein KSE_52310 [Kitasatospora setae KM-6054]